MYKVLLTLFLYCSLTHAQQAGSLLNYKLKADFENVQQAEKMMPALTKIINTKYQQDSVYSRTFNLYGIVQDYRGNSDSALYYYTKAQKYSHNAAGLVPILINAAVTQNAKGNYKKAIQLMERARKLNAKSNPVYDALTYQTLAISYFSSQKMDKAVNYLLKAINILEGLKDTRYLPGLRLNLANTYIQTNNYAFANDIFEEYLKNNMHKKLSRSYYIAQVNNAECLIELSHPAKAKAMLLRALPAIENAKEKELAAIVYAKLGILENLGKNQSAAIGYYKKAIPVLDSINSQYSTLIFSDYINLLNFTGDYKTATTTLSLLDRKIYKTSGPKDRIAYLKAAAETHKKTGNLVAGNEALTEIVRLNDSLNLLDHAQLAEEIQAKFQTQLQRSNNIALQKGNDTLTKTVNTEQKLLWMYILTSSGLIILILTFLRSSWLKSRLQKQELAAAAAEKGLMEKNFQFEQDLTNHQKNTISEKERELTSTALRMANYYDSLNAIIRKMDNSTYEKVHDVRKDLLNLVKQKNYWGQFEARFNNLHPDFGNTLMTSYDKLTKNDVEFCSLLKLNLSNKEIASLLQISHESVITKKYRIKKKMEISEDAEFEKILRKIN